MSEYGWDADWSATGQYKYEAERKRRAEAERVLRFVRDHGDGCDECCAIIDAYFASDSASVECEK